MGCISAGAAGTLNGSILDTFFFLRWNSTRIIRNVKGKGVAADPFAHPQTRPGMHFSSRVQLFKDRLALLNLRLNFNLLLFFFCSKAFSSSFEQPGPGERDQTLWNELIETLLPKINNTVF